MYAAEAEVAVLAEAEVVVLLEEVLASAPQLSPASVGLASEICHPSGDGSMCHCYKSHAPNLIAQAVCTPKSPSLQCSTAHTHFRQSLYYRNA